MHEEDELERHEHARRSQRAVEELHRGRGAASIVLELQRHWPALVFGEAGQRTVHVFAAQGDEEFQIEPVDRHLLRKAQRRGAARVPGLLIDGIPEPEAARGIEPDTVTCEQVAGQLRAAQHVGAVHPRVLHQHLPTGPNPEAAGVAEAVVGGSQVVGTLGWHASSLVRASRQRIGRSRQAGRGMLARLAANLAPLASARRRRRWNNGLIEPTEQSDVPWG